MDHYAIVDETVWPVNLDDIEWALRYGDPNQSERLVAASVVAAYRHLTDPTLRQASADAALRRARTAVRDAES